MEFRTSKEGLSIRCEQNSVIGACADLLRGDVFEADRVRRHQNILLDAKGELTVLISAEDPLKRTIGSYFGFTHLDGYEFLRLLELFKGFFIVVRVHHRVRLEGGPGPLVHKAQSSRAYR